MTRPPEDPTQVGVIDDRQRKTIEQAKTLAAIEERHTADEADGPPGSDYPEWAAREVEQLRADRGTLLAMLREARAEAERLRPIVEDVAQGGRIGERAMGLVVRARAALRPAGTLASIPVDSCDGGDR